MTLHQKNFSSFQNLLIGKTFILNKHVRAYSNLGKVFLKEGSQIQLLSFDEDGEMIAKFSHYGDEGIGVFSTLDLSLNDDVPEFLFRDVKLKEQVVLYSDMGEEFGGSDGRLFYVSSLFEINGEQHAFLDLLDKNGNSNATIVTTSPVSNLIIVD